MYRLRAAIAASLTALSLALVFACVGDDPEAAPDTPDTSPPETSTPSNDGGADAGPIVPQVGAGSGHACALTAAGEVWCWGGNVVGQAGADPKSGEVCSYSRCVKPTKVAGLPRIERLARFGEAAACAIDAEGGVWCWGKNDERQLGFDSTEMCNVSGTDIPCQSTPKRIEGIPPMVEVDVGQRSTCARTRDNAAWCWGHNASGQAGQSPPTTTPLAPAPVLAPLTDGVQQIATAQQPLTAAVRGNKAYTWGTNAYGALGRSVPGVPCNGGMPCEPTPGPVTLGDAGTTDLIGVVEVCVGTLIGVARLTNGAIYTWGAGNHGLLHDGDGRYVPAHFAAFANQATGAPKADAIDLKADHACLLSSGDVYCWGLNNRGQVGTENVAAFDCVGGPHACVGKARRVVLPAKAKAIATGINFVVALLADGNVFVWGSNTFWQAGRAPVPTDPEFDAAPASPDYAVLKPTKVDGLPPLLP